MRKEGWLFDPDLDTACLVGQVRGLSNPCVRLYLIPI